METYSGGGTLGCYGAHGKENTSVSRIRQYGDCVIHIGVRARVRVDFTCTVYVCKCHLPGTGWCKSVGAQTEQEEHTHSTTHACRHNTVSDGAISTK